MLHLTKGLISFFCLCMAFCHYAQDNKFTKRNKSAKVIQYSTQKCYSRSVKIKDSIVYTGNSNGTIFATDLRTGTSTNILQNIKFEEIRDIEFANGNLFGMQSGSFGVLAKTDKKKFIDFIIPERIWIETFLDGMDFHDNIGFIMGDPKKGYFSLYKSEDSGNTWKECETKLSAYEGEAGFAASGTNVQVLNDSTFYFVSGGRKSRFFKSTDRGKTWKITSLPYMTSESSGAFSICMANDSVGVIVGGDYANPDLCLNTCFYTDDGGKFWLNPNVQTRGYRSCVIYSKGVFYAAGTNGLDFSTDNGLTWKPFAHGNFIALTSDEKHLYATIPNGSFQIFELFHK